MPAASRLRQPSWLDGRLVIGVVLVLLSIVVGAKIIASSERYDVVWAASRDISPGTTLLKTDLVRVKVKFKDHGGVYVSAQGPRPAGRTTVEQLVDGELIPLAAVPATSVGAMRLVTVPVAKLHMPRGNDLHGEQVDLYVTPKSAAGDTAASPHLVLANVTIADTITDSSLGGSGGSGVVLSVPVPYVDAVVAAAQQGSVDLVRVPADGVVAQPSPGSAVPPSADTATPAASP